MARPRKKKLTENELWKYQFEQKKNYYWKAFLQFLAENGLENIFWLRRKKHWHGDKSLFVANKIWFAMKFYDIDDIFSHAFYYDETKEGEAFWERIAKKWACEVEFLRAREPKINAYSHGED